MERAAVLWENLANAAMQWWRWLVFMSDALREERAGTLARIHTIMKTGVRGMRLRGEFAERVRKSCLELQRAVGGYSEEGMGRGARMGMGLTWRISMGKG